MHQGQSGPALVSERVTRGNIVKVVSSTGALQAMTTVEVGSRLTDNWPRCVVTTATTPPMRL